jgi:anti-sigma-K factor RskA
LSRSNTEIRSSKLASRLVSSFTCWRSAITSLSVVATEAGAAACASTGGTRALATSSFVTGPIFV